MFGIGFPELLLILALALIVVGPDKLPDLARSIAKTLVDLKKTAEGLKDSIDLEDNPINDIKPKLEDAAKNFKETILDSDSPTWKVPEDLDELNKANHVPDAYEEWSRDGQKEESDPDSGKEEDQIHTGSAEKTKGGVNPEDKDTASKPSSGEDR